MLRQYYLIFLLFIIAISCTKDDSLQPLGATYNYHMFQNKVVTYSSFSGTSTVNSIDSINYDITIQRFDDTNFILMNNDTFTLSGLTFHPKGGSFPILTFHANNDSISLSNFSGGGGFQVWSYDNGFKQ